MPVPNVITIEEHFWTPELSGAGHRQAGAPERLSDMGPLRIREMEYAEAARTVGNPRRRIIFHHLLPNCLPPVIVQATLAMGFAILTVAALSYIGLGIRPPTSEWGAMTAEGAGYIVSGEWWVFLFPGTAIMATVLSFNLVGDALRDVLDPRMKGV